MLADAQETKLGQKNGAKKQYRYGKLHIREYDDKFLVHQDKIDPRKDPLGHLLHDAPEVLVGLAFAALGGTKATKDIKEHKSPFPTILGTLVSAYAGYLVTKKLKDIEVI